jgi:predicted amidohydrolase YtcJ
VVNIQAQIMHAPLPGIGEVHIMKSITLASIMLAAFAALSAPNARQPASPASLVLLNGKLVTLDDSQPQAEAIAIDGTRIRALGSTASMRRHIGEGTQVIDLNGRLVVPGFVEAHGHFREIGLTRLDLQLGAADSWEAIVAMVASAAKAARPGQWIYGRGWDHRRWSTLSRPSVDGFPTHHRLSEVSPANPVLLTHANNDLVLTNAKAMELSNIGRDRMPQAGGTLLKDAEGNPIGVFGGAAVSLVRRGVGEPPRAPAEQAERENRILELASQEVVSKGITSFHDAGAGFDEIDRVKTLIDSGRIHVRLWMMLRSRNPALAAHLARYRTVDYADGFLTVRGIKQTIDGQLSSRDAWLLEPYADDPGNDGGVETPLDRLRGTARLAIQHGYQLAVHAVGDRANRRALDVFEEVFAAHPDKTDLRWRIEHAQVLHPSDAPRFARLGVIASMQGVRCAADARDAAVRLGIERAARACAWHALIKSDAVVTNGTDAPVSDVNPILNYYATVSGGTLDGRFMNARRRMDRLQALRAATLAGAYAAFEERTRGSLTPGKYADMAVLSKDILTIDEQQIPTTEVTHTIIAGHVKYRR